MIVLINGAAPLIQMEGDYRSLHYWRRHYGLRITHRRGRDVGQTQAGFGVAKLKGYTAPQVLSVELNGLEV